MNENEFELNGKRYVAASRRRCSGCAFFDEDFNCDMIPSCESERRSDGRNVIFVEAPNPEQKPKPKTNGDRIRGMSNVELANFLSDITDCGICPLYDFCRANKYEICCKAMLHWMNSSAEEESEGK